MSHCTWPTLLIISIAVQKLFSLIKSYLFVFVFVAFAKLPSPDIVPKERSFRNKAIVKPMEAGRGGSRL